MSTPCACEATSFRDVCLVVLRFLHDGHRRQIETLQTLGDLAPAGEIHWHERQARALHHEAELIEKGVSQ